MATGVGPGIAVIGDGLQVIDGSEVTVVGATIEGNDTAAVLVDASTATITGCTISGGEAGIVVQNASLDAQRFEDNRQPNGAPVDPSSGQGYPEIPGDACGTAPPRPEL
jgi:hypothetical protein